MDLESAFGASSVGRDLGCLGIASVSLTFSISIGLVLDQAPAGSYRDRDKIGGAPAVANGDPVS